MLGCVGGCRKTTAQPEQSQSQKTKKMFNKKINIVVLLIIAVIFSNCTSKSSQKNTEEEHNHDEATEGMAVLSQTQREAIDLKVGTLSMRNMSGVIKANGVLKVSPTDKAEITSFMGGNVKSIKVFQGDKVRKSQVLATLEHPDFIKLQQEFIQAAQDYSFSQKEYERQKKLYENDASSGKSFQKTEAQYRNDKAQYEGLKIRLKMLNLDYQQIEKGNLATEVRIISPISGYVSQIDISLGSFVNATTKMFTISNNDNIHADLLVYEKEIPNLAVGQKARLRVANMPNLELEADIFSIDKEYQQDSRAVVAHARIKNVPDELISGSYVSGDIFTQSTNQQSLPETAIVQDGGKKYIFVFDAEGSNAANHSEAEELEDDHDHDHDHEDADAHEDAETENHIAEVHNHSGDVSYGMFKDKKIAFRMVEVVTGVEDDGYVAIAVVEPLPDKAQIVLDGAFYLLSDLKKSEAAHQH